MRSPRPQLRFRAVSMEFAVQLEERRVDMLIVAADGTTVAMECGNDALLTIQQHIGEILRQCPEIALWANPEYKCDARAGVPAAGAA